MKIAVIGGGPAGMMAAISASQNQNEVYLLEKNSKLGKKLLITGKGRCNITSSLDIHEFIANIPGNGSFLYSAFNNYTNQDIIEFLKKNGVAVKEERFTTDIEELDRVLGGGIVKGSLVLVGGDPGIGKSTLLMQVSSKVANTNKKVLYISGEESESQIKMRASRLGVNSQNLYIFDENKEGRPFTTLSHCPICHVGQQQFEKIE